MKTVLLVYATILGVLSSPAVSNDKPEFNFWKNALAVIDQNADAGQRSMEQLFVQLATSNKALESIAWNEIHPEFKSYADALVNVNLSLRKTLSSGKSELQPQQRKELITLSSDVLKARKGSDDDDAIASGWINIYNTLNKMADTVTVLFCTNVNFMGDCFNATIYEGCNTINSTIYNNKISSADTYGGCAFVFDNDICTEDYMVMSDTIQTGYIKNFGDYGYNDKISSFAGC